MSSAVNKSRWSGTDHITAEALDTPFLLLPFRPDSDAGGARSFVRNFYKSNAEGSEQYRGASLRQELRLTEPNVLCSIIKWCWSRIPNGVVTWPVYEGFQVGEGESNMARNAFHTFIPIGAASEARTNIIFDFFDLLCAVAAHGKMNGLGGRKLSRLAGWWAFEQSDDGKGFVGGYNSWTSAADASSHLFFAYLRSLSPEADPSMSVIERIPRSLQALLASTEYPPETPTLMQRSTPRVVMLVDSVSPTPFALLRRAKHFEYRDNDRTLREYQEFEDPVDALTEECKRVLDAISSINSSTTPRSRHGEIKTGQESWSAFQNLGFSDLDERALAQKTHVGMNGSARPNGQGLRTQPRSRNADHGRPTTPSWADFLSSGFSEDDVAKTPTTLSLPSDQRLPPLGSRTQTPMNGADDNLAPGELAAITDVDLDDAFWWVWMTSLAGEEPAERKGVFGRCALVETSIQNGKWLIMEEQVQGASPDPAEGAYIAPKKSSIFSFGKRGKNKRPKNERIVSDTSEPIERITSATPSKSSLAPDQHSKIRAAAAELARRQNDGEGDAATRRGRHDDAASVKTSSMLTMGMMSEASPAMKWANAYDKHEIRKQYLGDSYTGKGASSVNLPGDRASSVFPPAPTLTPETQVFPADSPLERDLPAPPEEPRAVDAADPSIAVGQAPRNKAPPALPAMQPKVPAVNILPADTEETQKVAEQTPLPQASPAEHPVSALDKELAVESSTSPKGRVERKPVPRADNMQEHPAFRQRSDDEPSLVGAPNPAAPAVPQTPQAQTNPPNNPAAIAAQRAMDVRAPSSSPESLQKQPVAKLKKQGGGGGLKKLFGRKKDNPNRNSVEVRPASNKGLAPPAESNLGRRLSLIRKKPSSRGTPNTSQVTVDQPASEMVEEPVVPDSHGQFEQSAADVSQVNSKADANPEDEFSRFDQGPIEDMPVAAPHDSEEDDLDLPSSPPQRQFNTQMASRIAPEQQETAQDEFTTPAERGDPMNDAQSETTMEEPRRIEPAADRWAQIRENAAKRAARASEEQSMQSRPSVAQSRRETDDGETSGEESQSILAFQTH